MAYSPSDAVTSLNDPPFYLNPSVGDLVLRSSDDIDFHVHRDILVHTSPTLSTMLTLPKAASARSIDATSGKPLLQVQEYSRVWAHLVHLIYVPRAPEPALDASQLVLICAILEAARKYSLTSVTECMRRILKSPEIVEAKPVGVYALACVYGLEDVARIAARKSLSKPLGTDYDEELDLISVRTFHRLSAYRSRCVAAALEGTSVWYNVRDRSEELGACTGTSSCSPKGRLYKGIRPSWSIYLEKLRRSLEQTPDAAKPCSPSLLEPVIESTEKCLSCLQAIHHSVKVVSCDLERRVREEIDKVVLEF